MSSAPVLACLWVHFILQVSSILRAEPNSRACGSAKKRFFLFENNYVFLKQRMLCLPHTCQYASEPAMTHFLYLFAQVPPVRRGAETKRNHKMSRHSGTCSARRMGTYMDRYHSSVYPHSLFVQSTQPSNQLPAGHFSHLLLHWEPIFLGIFTSPSSSFASKPHYIHIVLTSSHTPGVISKPL